MPPRKRIEELRALIRRHEKKYYQNDRPEISDEEFDGMMAELRTLEEAHPELATTGSPTQKVGGEASPRFSSYEHNPPMLSLDNSYSENELLKFDERVKKGLEGEEVEYVSELKIDGLGINLIYENGKLAHGVTRGDGKIGEDVTANVKAIGSIPQKTGWDKNWGRAEIRGEIYMQRPDFEKLNAWRRKKDEREFANPRNAAAGSIRLLDASVTKKRKLQFAAYALYLFDKGGSAMRESVVKTHLEMMAELKKLGFPVGKDIKKHSNIKSIMEEVSLQAEKREQLDYDVDGMVIKVNSFKQQNELGSTSKFPRWALAYKFAAQQAETTIKDITVQVGRTGSLTPVAELEPILLSGSTISRATLHNEDEIKRKDIRVGDRVVIEKGGDIIPKVVSVVIEKRTSQSRAFVMPETCPACGSKTVREKDEAAWRCIDKKCPAQIKEAIKHFVSRNAMDIDGLGPSLINQMLEAGIIKDVADLFDLDYQKVAELEKMGGKSADNLQDAVETAKSRGMQRLLMGLGIRHVGERAALLLSRRYGSIEELMKAGEEELAEIFEIGRKMAGSIAAFFGNDQNRKLLEKLKSLGVSTEGKTGVLDKQTLTGKSFVITGTLEGMARNEAKELITRAGGRVVSAVSKKTDYLLAGGDPGSKLEKAKSLGVAVITRDELLRLLAINI